MKRGELLKWCAISVIGLVIGFLFGFSTGHIREIQLQPSANLLSTGTLLRNIGVAVFAVSVWYSQNRLNKTNQLIKTLSDDVKEMIALELTVSLRDVEGLEELNSISLKLDPKDLESVKRKISSLKYVDRVRNLAIVLFIIGASFEAWEIFLNWSVSFNV